MIEFEENGLPSGLHGSFDHLGPMHDPLIHAPPSVGERLGQD